MRVKNFLAALFVMATGVAATNVPLQTQAPLPHDQSQLVRYGDLKWEKGEFPDGGATFEYAIVHQDPDTKATKLFLRVPAGAEIPRHHHTSVENVLVLQGSLVLTMAGELPRTPIVLADQQIPARQDQAVQQEQAVGLGAVQVQNDPLAQTYFRNDFLYIPSAMSHVGKVLPGEDLLLYIQSESAWDVVFD